MTGKTKSGFPYSIQHNPILMPRSPLSGGADSAALKGAYFLWSGRQENNYGLL
jgi:hypothetical protein